MKILKNYEVKLLEKDGLILVGLYNRFGRFRTLVRKYLYKILGKKHAVTGFSWGYFA